MERLQDKPNVMDVVKQATGEGVRSVSSLALKRGKFFPFIAFHFFTFIHTHTNFNFLFPRKRTKKNPLKAGRKKAKKDTTTESAQVQKEAATPRTRAAIAREKALAAAKEADVALAAARQAAEIAEAAAREVEGRSPVAALQAQAASQVASPEPSTRRCECHFAHDFDSLTT